MTFGAYPIPVWRPGVSHDRSVRVLPHIQELDFTCAKNTMNTEMTRKGVKLTTHNVPLQRIFEEGIDPRTYAGYFGM